MSLKVQHLQNSTDTASSNGVDNLNGNLNGNPNKNGKVENIVSKVIPPEIPHVSMNMTPLNLILKRQSIYTFKQLKEFLKSLESNSQSDNLKKKHFLELLVQFRENFIRLYVLCKWSRNSKSVEKLIDLFVWLREQNQVITNAILYLGTLKQSLVTAKMPEPDLSTALEVLIQGRPQLPTYNYVKKNPLKPELILKTLKYLNVELSTRMALQENLPKLFHSYIVKDGRVTFKVPSSFNCSISINDDTPNSKFFLIDFKLGFELKDNHLIPSTKPLNASTFRRLELLANKELSANGLQGLFRLLYNYSATCKLYLLHRQLIQLRMGLWRSHLSHIYNADKSLIIITYWIQKKSTPSTIEIGKFDTGNKNNELNFRWNKEGVLFNDHNLKLINDNGIIDIEDLIRKIIQSHIELNINQTKINLSNTVENVDKFVTILNNNKIILGVSQTKDVMYSIDSLSGHCYFENPTELMNLIAFKINNDPKLDYIELLRLRLETQLNEISSKLNATGWLKVNSIKLNQEEISKLDVNYEYLKDKNLSSRLLDIKVYKRKEWPVGWFLMIGISGYSSKVQIWCSRIKSYQGQWLVNWSNKLDVINKDLTISYNNLLDLVKLCSSKLISNLIVKELEVKGCKINLMNLNDLLVQKFIKKNFDIIIDENDNDKFDIHENKLSLDENKSDNSIMMIKNKSLYNIQNSKDALILIISIKNGNLNLSIFGKLILDNKIPVINFIDENKSSVNYNPETKIFKVESKIDLTDKFSDRKISKLSSTLSSSLPTKTTTNTISNSAVTATANINSTLNNGLLDLNGSIKTINNNSIMFNTLSVLRKFSSLLGLLQLITKDNTLKIQNILLDSISFQYGELFEESITLKISHSQQSSIEIELPKDNPHQNCIQYLNKLVSTDDLNFLKIKELVTYLKLTLNFYKIFIILKDKQRLMLKEFNEGNQKIDLDKGQELKVLPEQGFNLNLFSFEILRIMYFKTIKLDKKKNQTAKAELYKVNLKIELRHRINKLSLIHSQYLISVDERTESSGTIMEGKLKNFADQFFTGNTQIPVNVKDGNIVYLRSSICCNYKCVYEVVLFLHEKLKEIVYV